MVPQTRAAQAGVHPPLLVLNRDRLAGKDSVPDSVPVGLRAVHNGGKAPHDDPAVGRRGPGSELVGPGEVVAGAGGEHLDRDPPFGQPPGHGGQDRLGAADHTVAESGRHQRHGAAVDHRIVGTKRACRIRGAQAVRGVTADHETTTCDRSAPLGSALVSSDPLRSPPSRRPDAVAVPSPSS